MGLTFLDPSEFKPLQVECGEFISPEAAIKKFRKIVDREGTLKAVIKRARGHQKPSEKRIEKRKKAIHNQRRNENNSKRTSTLVILKSLGG